MRRVARRAAPLLLACLALGLFASVPSSRDAWAGAADPPDALLTRWLAALDAGDHAAYLACLHTGARAVPEYGSREAMRFWALEIVRLRDRGFVGRFAFEPVNEGGPRVPGGALRARPVLAGEPMGDAIVLVREDGRWKILRLFS